MDFVRMQKLIKLAHNYDMSKEYKKADKVFIKISQYYVEESVTQVKNVQTVDFSEDSILQNEIDDNWKLYWEKKPEWVVKETKGKPAKKDELSLEGQMHGSQNDGAAAYDPGNPASSPSMQNDLSRFEWDNIRDENHPEYDRIPVR